MAESNPHPKAKVHFPPLYPTLTSPSLIFFGTIEPSPTDNWASRLTNQLSHLPIQILNPRRDDWDSTWREEVSFPKFRETVEWDIHHAAQAKLIVFYFKPETLCPISLMELGMYAALYGKGGDRKGEDGKVIVCCPVGFYKRGHVEIVCKNFDVKCYTEVEEFESAVRERMEKLCHS